MGWRLMPDVSVRLIERQPPLPVTRLVEVMGGGSVPVPLLDPEGSRGHRRRRDLVPRRGPGVGRGALTRSSSCRRADRLLVLGQPRGVNGPRRSCCRRRCSSH